MHGLTFAVISWGLFRRSLALTDKLAFAMMLNMLPVGSVLLSLWSNAGLKSFWKYNDKWVTYPVAGSG